MKGNGWYESDVEGFTKDRYSVVSFTAAPYEENSPMFLVCLERGFESESPGASNLECPT